LHTQIELLEVNDIVAVLGKSNALWIGAVCEIDQSAKTAQVQWFDHVLNSEQIGSKGDFYQFTNITDVVPFSTIICCGIWMQVHTEE